MRTEVLTRSKGGMWAWLFQRITAVLLSSPPGAPGATHFVAIGELSYDNIAERLAAAAVLVIDIVLLVGRSSSTRSTACAWSCSTTGSASAARAASCRRPLGVGVGAFVYGMWALWPWIKLGGRR